LNSGEVLVPGEAASVYILADSTNAMLQSRLGLRADFLQVSRRYRLRHVLTAGPQEAVPNPRCTCCRRSSARGGEGHGSYHGDRCTLFSTIILPAAIKDAEALAYDARENVFYVGGGFSSNIWQVNSGGEILETITVLGGFRNPVGNALASVKDIELAPSSDPNDDPGKLNLYVTDYGNSHVNDGRLFEIDLGNALLM
jgi:hypothetical protein